MAMSTTAQADSAHGKGSDGALSAETGLTPATDRSLERDGVAVQGLAVSEQSAATDVTVAKGLGLQCMPAYFISCRLLSGTRMTLDSLCACANAVVPPEDKVAGSAQDEREKIIELYRKVHMVRYVFSVVALAIVYNKSKEAASEHDRQLSYAGT